MFTIGQTIFIVLSILYLISMFLAWGIYIGRERKMCPNGRFCIPPNNTPFKKKAYDAAIVRAIAGPFSILYSFKYEGGVRYGFKLT
jgi:hypothetical protein